MNIKHFYFSITEWKFQCIENMSPDWKWRISQPCGSSVYGAIGADQNQEKSQEIGRSYRLRIASSKKIFGELKFNNKFFNLKCFFPSYFLRVIIIGYLKNYTK